MKEYLLAIDQGTTSTRSILFDIEGHEITRHQIELPQIFPYNGWVEHDPEIIWQHVIQVVTHCVEYAGSNKKNIKAIGISNQRETTVVWNKSTGKPIYNAIVWQDRRTVDLCEQLVAKGELEHIQHKTGLLVDPYFSATKLAWILNHVDGARDLAQQGQLAFGTIDSFLLWKLTGGKSHFTDATNAARTMLFNIHSQQWDNKLLKLFDIPSGLLPKVLDNSARFGVTDNTLFGIEIPITGMAGDQQAAAIGHACLEEGTVKSTYGTGCFMLANTGDKPLASKNRLITTIAYRLDGCISYALEGSIFVAGAAVHWLRDYLNLIGDVSETESIAQSIKNTNGVYLVPAFTGLGAPYWDPDARGALLGLTRDTGIAEIVRAALEASCYQSKDLLNAMIEDGLKLEAIQSLRVDGGMSRNNWFLQFLADILGVQIARPDCTETSALGAALLAGYGVGLYESPKDFAKVCQQSNYHQPKMQEKERERLYEGWQQAVARIRNDSTQ